MLHDINFQFLAKKVLYSSNDHLFTYLKGKKIIPKVPEVIPNIGAILLDDDQKKHYFDYFFALTSTWSYIPKIEEWNFIRNFIVKYYEKELIDIYDSSYKLNKNLNIFLKGKKEEKKRQEKNFEKKR